VAVLDDEVDVAASICQCLRLQGLDAIAFTDPDTLWLAAKGGRFHAFVLDWTLAHGTSEALIRSLREHPRVGSAPIFVLTATSSFGGVPADRQLARAVKQYGLHYRPKPFSCAVLGEQLRQASSTHLRIAVRDTGV
jgi:DNA-binding response OmpR family regulator